MSFECGIVGLPNAGKSTLFNALTATSMAQTAAYPFCTIEPNQGSVCVPDNRLGLLAQLAESKKIVPSQLKFVDIAGLVKGASQGEGLGNKFLGHIREVDAIIHVVRCFERQDMSLQPLSDIEIVETELLLADLQSVERQLATRKKKKAETPDVVPILEKVQTILEKGCFVRNSVWEEKEKLLLKPLNFLTAKPFLYVCNVSESDICDPFKNTAVQAVQSYAKQAPFLCISAQIESEISVLPLSEQPSFLESVGLQETGLSHLIRAGYGLLNLQTFFTVGPKEAHAWTIPKGATACDAAGVIHTDFQTGFIRAEVIAYEDYVFYNSLNEIKAAGKNKIEGRDYIVQDGDILLFRFNL